MFVDMHPSPKWSEINKNVRQSPRINITLESLDEFSRQLEQPHAGRKKLPRRYFRDQVPLHKGDQARGFAADTIAAMHVLSAICTLVVDASGVLVQQVQCFRAACEILDLLMTGDHAVQHYEKLLELATFHHFLFIELYGRELARPKLHYLYHCIIFLWLLRRNMNTLSAERKHKLCNDIARNNHAHQEISVLYRAISNTLDGLQEATSFQDFGAPVEYVSIACRSATNPPHLCRKHCRSSCAEKICALRYMLYGGVLVFAIVFNRASNSLAVIRLLAFVARRAGRRLRI